MQTSPDAAVQTAANSDARPSLSTTTLLLFAIASGLAVANVYFAHPLLDVMADDIGLDRSTAGLIVGASQIGYGLGLIFLVPLGDLFDRRKLIVAHFLLSSLTLAAVGIAGQPALLFLAMAATGLLAVVTQALVAYAASLAEPMRRGRVVGIVTSGIVLGILLARAVAGALTDIGGWRSVYLSSAVVTLLIGLMLWRSLPRQKRQAASVSYPALILSLATLFKEEPVLRIRAIIAMLIFADITTLLAPLVMPLSAPPFELSHAEIGLFGLAGAAGALAASRAGSAADRGHAQRMTGIALALMLVAWAPIALLGQSLLWLIVGVLIIDFGLQAVHVTNQAMIYRVRPDAQNRLTAAYMVFYSIGSASGSAISTWVYVHAGWNGVCLLGAGISLVTLVFWAATLKTTPEAATQAVSCSA
ncbi:putative MFS family arabinose efflux permease [Ochrobactrum sp. 19YEA23]|uniref:MFS transporter n=1 Tax=Ochrobactrum sp. 19YEA23 TaxID=3039854 RepID=UPI002479E4D9|nr:putative MFS family arabinose efflux permease [Ochrobactrum sp. 19YEA23]